MLREIEYSVIAHSFLTELISLLVVKVKNGRV